MSDSGDWAQLLIQHSAYLLSQEITNFSEMVSNEILDDIIRKIGYAEIERRTQLSLVALVMERNFYEYYFEASLLLRDWTIIGGPVPLLRLELLRLGLTWPLLKADDESNLITANEMLPDKEILTIITSTVFFVLEPVITHEKDEKLKVQFVHIRRVLVSIAKACKQSLAKRVKIERGAAVPIRSQYARPSIEAINAYLRLHPPHLLSKFRPWLMSALATYGDENVLVNAVEAAVDENSDRRMRSKMLLNSTNTRMNSKRKGGAHLNQHEGDHTANGNGSAPSIAGSDVDQAEETMKEESSDNNKRLKRIADTNRVQNGTGKGPAASQPQASPLLSSPQRGRPPMPPPTSSPFRPRPLTIPKARLGRLGPAQFDDHIEGPFYGPSPRMAADLRQSATKQKPVKMGASSSSSSGSSSSSSSSSRSSLKAKNIGTAAAASILAAANEIAVATPPLSSAGRNRLELAGAPNTADGTATVPDSAVSASRSAESSGQARGYFKGIFNGLGFLSGSKVKKVSGSNGSTSTSSNSGGSEEKSLNMEAEADDSEIKLTIARGKAPAAVPPPASTAKGVEKGVAKGVRMGGGNLDGAIGGSDISPIRPSGRILDGIGDSAAKDTTVTNPDSLGFTLDDSGGGNNQDTGIADLHTQPLSNELDQNGSQLSNDECNITKSGNGRGKRKGGEETGGDVAAGPSHPHPSGSTDQRRRRSSHGTGSNSSMVHAAKSPAVAIQSFAGKVGLFGHIEGEQE